MAFFSGMSGRFWPGVLIFVLLALRAAPGAGPRLVPAYSSPHGEFSLSVMAHDFPRLKRMVLTFSYTPSLVNPAEAIVSSPLPETAFGALLDTVNKKIVINIIAASAISPGNGTALALVRSLAAPGAGSQDALELTGAMCIDTDGNEIIPAIGSGSNVQYRSPGAFTETGAALEQAGVFFSVNGRRIVYGASRAAGVRYTYGRKFLILQGGSDKSPITGF